MTAIARFCRFAVFALLPLADPAHAALLTYTLTGATRVNPHSVPAGLPVVLTVILDGTATPTEIDDDEASWDDNAVLGGSAVIGGSIFSVSSERSSVEIVNDVGVDFGALDLVFFRLHLEGPDVVPGISTNLMFVVLEAVNVPNNAVTSLSLADINPFTSFIGGAESITSWSFWLTGCVFPDDGVCSVFNDFISGPILVSRIPEPTSLLLLVISALAAAAGRMAKGMRCAMCTLAFGAYRDVRVRSVRCRVPVTLRPLPGSLTPHTTVPCEP
jgi:hypothetical protein